MKIEFFFDFLSPYSYFAWCWVKENRVLIEELGYEWDLTPVIMAKVIKSYDTKGPAEIAPKRNYLLRDCLRKSAKSNIPFVTPEKLPFNSQGLLRIVESVQNTDQKWEVIDLLFRACWQDGLDLEQDEVVAEVLSQRNINGEDLIQASSQKEVRRRLKNNVDSAIKKGVFGVPSFYVRDELFWGHDSLSHLVAFLSKEDPLDKDLYQQILKKHDFEIKEP